MHRPLLYEQICVSFRVTLSTELGGDKREMEGGDRRSVRGKKERQCNYTLTKV